MTTCRNACKEVAIRSWMAKSIPFRPSGLLALVEGGALGSVPFRSTSIRGRSQADSSAVAAFQSGSSSKSNSRALRPPFSPSGQTTWPLHCSSLCTCNWSRQLQVFILGMPSVIMPMCPSRDKGMLATVSFIHTQAYGQLGPSLASNISF